MFFFNKIYSGKTHTQAPTKDGCSESVAEKLTLWECPCSTGFKKSLFEKNFHQSIKNFGNSVMVNVTYV